MTTDGSSTTATVETLTAEVRVLMVGNRQITLSVARQLDRVDNSSYHPEVITPFGRVKTGTKIERDRIKPRYRRYPVEQLPLDAFEIHIEDPRLEVIGRSNRDENRGALVLYEVGWGDSRLGDPADAAEVDAIFNQWEKLPLIVLAGLR